MAKVKPGKSRTMNAQVAEMIDRASEEGIEICWDRYDQMQPQCGFGELGVCCRNCLQGPCRVNPFGTPARGICGISADGIVARNLARNAAGGAATHTDHAFEAVEMLDKVADGTVPYEIKDVKKLRAVAERVGVPTKGKSRRRLAKDVSKKAFEDFAPGKETMVWLSSSVPEERLECWRNLGILPEDPDLAIRRVMHQTTMGVDADATNLTLGTAMMGLVDAYGGLKLGTDIQDIVFGTPTPVKTTASLGVLSKDKVNIVVHGHVPFLSEKIVEWARKLEPEAKKVGAKGIQLSGLCCTGNEVLMRQGVPSAGSWLTQELAMATGAVDLMVVDVQCIMPGLAQVAKCFHTKLVTTHKLAKIPGAEHVPFNADTADEDAQRIVRMGIANFKNRDQKRVQIPEGVQEMWGGFSTEAILDLCSALNPDNPIMAIVDALKSGKIRGIAVQDGCENTRFKQDSMILTEAQEFLKNDILVLTTGCSAHALGAGGFMSPAGAKKYCGKNLLSWLTEVGEKNGLKGPIPPVLHMGSCVDNSRYGDLFVLLADAMGVTIPELPIVTSASELAHEKAIAIGTWCVCLGVLTHVGMPPFVAGSPQVVKLLTNDLEGLVGAKFYVESDPVVAAENMIKWIDGKREKLGF
jgi:carbon-monoxide dehydrogenase catalytic subunit